MAVTENNVLYTRPYDALSTNYGKTDVTQNTRGLGQAGSITASAIQDVIGNYISDKFQTSDSDLGRIIGTVASQGVNSALNTVGQNVIKGKTITEGLGQNVGSTLTGVGVGLAAQGIGKGISSAGGNSMLSRGFGQAAATAGGTIGGLALQNLVKTGSVGKLFGNGSGMINPYGFAGQVIGSGLQAAFGPSKEYNGRYGHITKTMDTVYDGLQTAVNFIPVWGQIASGAMALNKGLSNMFGSTDGMTRNDAILGSAFMPAHWKWINTLTGHTTSSFDKQNQYTIDRTNRFMGNAFGNLGDRFQRAREESNKRYGGGVFGIGNSNSAYKAAQENIDFSNIAFDKVLTMADESERQNIKAYDMSSINNQKYAQQIQGGYNPVLVGKHGMKILNNAINHNIGMRLLSGAALIDNKQMILCNVQD